MLPLFYTTILPNAVSRRNHNEVRSETYTQEVPAWVRDNLVLKLLDDQGFIVEIIYDRKYLNGLCNKPLVVIKSRNRK